MERHASEEPNERLTALCQALAAELEAGRKLLLRLTDEAYAIDLGAVGLRSLGAHERHVLDVCEALLDGLAEGTVDYRNRARHRVDEVERHSALERAARVIEAFVTLEATDRPLEVRDTLVPGRAPAVTHSSLGRELLFLFQHVVHHHALMRIAARMLGVPTPPGFGTAPSTIEAWLKGGTAQEGAPT